MSITIQSTDGHTVTYDPNGLWKQWSINEVYTGSTGLNKYVPKINDWVVDPATGQVFRCTAVDDATLIPTLSPLTSGENTGLTDAVGNLPDTYRVTLDTTSIPYTLMVDPRFFVGGSDVSYARIYRGTNTTHTGEVLSFIYDNVGNLLGNNIPLEDVARHNVTNILQKAVKVCKTHTPLSNGEIVTLVVYSDEGRVFTERSMKVVLGSWIPATAADLRYVTHVSLQSPFMSTVDNTLLEYPINVQLSALNLFGVVHYSDGSQSDPQPIDGNKFAVFGLEQFVGVYPTQRAALTLRYRLDVNEAAYGAVSADGKFMTAAYQLVTTEQQGAYTVRLSGYPAWNVTESAYRMRWFMTDLNRDTAVDVTPYVYLNNTSDIFNGTLYGQAQTLSVRMNLRDLSTAYPSYIHTQVERVTLNGVGTAAGPNWKVAFDLNQQPLFGENLHATAVMINQNLWRVNVRFGAATYQEWLNRVYFDAKPLFDIRTEAKAPEPTHMVIFNGAVRTEVPIGNWDKEFQVAVNFSALSNIQIEFIRKMAATTLKLAVVAMPIKRL